MGFPGEGHLVDLAVACLAADSFGYMDAVVEIDEVGQVVDPVPGKRGIVAEACPDRFEYGRLVPDLGVTSHAGFSWRNPGKSSFFNRGVAVSAVQAHARDVVLVAEGGGLVQRNVDLIDEVGAIDVEQEPKDGADQHQPQYDAGPGCPIGAARKYLSHVDFARFGDE